METNYSGVRRRLQSDGWVENLEYNPKHEKLSKEQNSLCGIISRLIRNQPVNFVWAATRRERRTNDAQQILAAPAYLNFNTKSNLAQTVRNIAVVTSADLDAVAPRAYRMHREKDANLFYRDFISTACLNILKFATGFMNGTRINNKDYSVNYWVPLKKQDLPKRFPLSVRLQEEKLIGTKFDIRQWFIVTWHPLALWLYNHCHLRFSTAHYTLSNFDEKIHLTNNAIQGKYFDSVKVDSMIPRECMWRRDDFIQYLSSKGMNGPQIWIAKIVPEITRLLTVTLIASSTEMDMKAFSLTINGITKPRPGNSDSFMKLSTLVSITLLRANRTSGIDEAHPSASPADRKVPRFDHINAAWVRIVRRGLPVNEDSSETFRPDTFIRPVTRSMRLARPDHHIPDVTSTQDNLMACKTSDTPHCHQYFSSSTADEPSEVQRVIDSYTKSPSSSTRLHTTIRMSLRKHLSDSSEFIRTLDTFYRDPSDPTLKRQVQEILHSLIAHKTNGKLERDSSVAVTAESPVNGASVAVAARPKISGPVERTDMWSNVTKITRFTKSGPVLLPMQNRMQFPYPGD
ncbi:putative Tubulin monoglycylase TTLL3 [Hypsibius exemplaris]|uniref:Tubulin monoglycylase TTLL3 n=1 Tax=Hypsibius exemplaris TaxID=2072580 RepID=A0A1W0WWK0_HYPEX|nr:putative Tubulin monoglycylase TTLL3 [Hypsibius exemplaris]